MAIHSYRIAGLAVMSEMELPGAIPAPAGAADVSVACRPTPERLDQPTMSGPVWELDDRRFLLRLPGIGRFLACDGQTLDIDPEPGASLADTLVFALGTCLGALLYQRGAMVLHASAVGIHGNAFAICGRSGAGKSTLAAALCRAGCGFVSDDVSAIGLGDRGWPAISPDGRRLKLFEKSIAALDLASRKGASVRSVIDKFYVEPPTSSAQQAMPLAGVYVLTTDRPSTAPMIELLSPLNAAQALMNESYRPRLALAMARSGQHMPLTAAVVRQVPVYNLFRPVGLEHLDDVVFALKAHMRDLSPESPDAVPT